MHKPAPAWNSIFPFVCKELNLMGYGCPIQLIKVNHYFPETGIPGSLISVSVIRLYLRIIVTSTNYKKHNA